MKTLILTRQDVEKILTPAVANDTVEKAFRAYGAGRADMPPKSYLYFPKGDLRSMPAYVHLNTLHAAGIKCVTVHPQNPEHQLPTVMAVVILNDPQTGFPLAILDGTYLTGIRTGAAGAIAAKYLSREDAQVAGFVGCGAQARWQLACLIHVRKIRKIKIWQFPGDRACALDFRRWAKDTFDLETLLSDNIDEVTLNADIVVTSTPSRTVLVKQVSAGTHINAIGADAQGKQEIDPRILKHSRIVIDDWVQAFHSGEINVPIRKRQIGKKDIYAPLGDIVAGKKKGRKNEEEITLFDSTGLAIQDISCAFVVYTALKNRKTVTRIQLF